MVMATASLYHPYDTGDLTLEVRVSVNVTIMLNLKKHLCYEYPGEPIRCCCTGFNTIWLRESLIPEEVITHLL